MRSKIQKALTNYEISIVKRILLDGGTNQEALTWINKKRLPKMSVNPARIAEVKSSKVGKDIPIASKIELKRFKQFEKISPIDRNTLKMLFSFTQDKINSIESETIEYKENFSIPEMYDCYATIAGMANNQGGYLVFGVRDDLTFKGLDIEKVDAIKDFFNKKINFQQIFNKNIKLNLIIFNPLKKKKPLAIIYIYPSPTKPIISIKDNKSIKEGTIYYRYFAKTEKIHAGELEQIIENRCKEFVSTKMVKIIKRELVKQGIIEEKNKND